MGDLLPVLIFIFFVVVPLLERLRKKPAPPRTPRERVPPPREGGGPWGRPVGEPAEEPEYEASAPVGAEPKTGREDAEAVIPDDLWELLTGERRRPAPVPRPIETEREGSAWEEEPDELEELARPPEERPAVASAPAHEAEPDWRRLSAPLEASPAARLAALAPEPGRIRFRAAAESIDIAAWRPRRRAVPLGLTGRDELRRAFLLREVLGPPKGLE